MKEEKPLAELTFYNPNNEENKSEIHEIPRKNEIMKRTSGLPRDEQAPLDLFCFTFNKHKYSTPSPGGPSKKRSYGIGSAVPFPSNLKNV